MKIYFPAIMIGFVYLISSCTKIENPNILATYRISDRGQINKIAQLSDTSIAVIGGNRWENGFFYTCNIDLKSCVKVTGLFDESDFFLTDIFYSEARNEVLITGFGGQIFRSANKGLDWEFVRELNYDSFECISTLEDGSLLIGGGAFRHGGYTYRSSSPEWWRLEYDTLPCKINEFLPLGSNEVLAAGEGAVLYSKDSGKSWSRTEVTGDYFNAFSFPEQKSIFLSGTLGSVWKSTDNAHNWEQLRKSSAWNTKGFFTGMDFYDAYHGILVGLDGVILYTNNAGQNFQQIQLEPVQDLYAALMTSESTAIVAGADGMIFIISLQ
jgi:photosystem II stability/assembly factor-like uncharacterized protein